MNDIEKLLKDDIKKITPNVLNKIKDLNLQVKVKKPFLFMVKKLSLAFTSLTLLIGLFSIIFLRHNAITTLAIDMIPSIEIDINYFDVVIDVRGINEEGKEFAKELNIIGQEITQISDKLIEKAIEKQYLRENINCIRFDNSILITVKGMLNEKNDGLKKELISKMIANINKEYHNLVVEFYEGKYQIEFELFEKNQFRDISIPKLNVINAILKYRCFETCTLTKEELMNQIIELSKLSIGDLIEVLQMYSNTNIRSIDDKEIEFTDWPLPLFPLIDRCDKVNCTSILPLIPNIITN